MRPLLLLAFCTCASQTAKAPSALDKPATPTTPSTEKRPITPESAARRIEELLARLAKNGNDTEASLEIGLLFERMGDGMRAKQYLERAWLLKAPADAALPALVRVCVRMDDYRGAIEYARTYSEALAPKCVAAAEPAATDGCNRLAEVRVTWASLHAAVGDHAAARATFHAALEADPSQADAYLGLARIEQDSFHDREQARRVLLQGLDKVSGPPAARLRAALANLDSAVQEGTEGSP